MADNPSDELIDKLSPEFLVAIAQVWEQRGQEVIERVMEEHPELIAQLLDKQAKH